MGIEKFFNSIEENNIANLDCEFTCKLKTPVKTKYLLIDFNSIVHITSVDVVNDLNYILYYILKGKVIGNVKVLKLMKQYDLDDNVDMITLKTVNLDNIILDKVKEYVINIITNFVDPKLLEYLYIAVDGVPNKTKMLEQKKRRYMGAIIGLMKKRILEKWASNLDKLRYEFEMHKFSWYKINISPGTEFLKKLNVMLRNLDFGKILPKLKEYAYSGSDEFGEGEKKIVDYVNIKYKSGVVTVYSPDSDMTLLCLLLSNKVHDIFILRHNQQEHNYDVVNILLLRQNLCNYVNNGIEVPFKCDRVIDDIVFILTIFGNDFLPKIESVNVKTDFTKIIDKYIKLLEISKDYVIMEHGNSKVLNQPVFVELLAMLHRGEGANLQNIYMVNHYQNYNKLKRVLGADNDNFVSVMNDFLGKLRKFNRLVRDNNINDNWLNEQKEFIEVLSKLTKINRTVNNEDFIKEYVEYYKTNNKLAKVRIGLNRFSKSINDSYYRDRLEKSLDNIDETLKITKYDEEIFKLDNMLDEYVQKLHAYPLNLGNVSVDMKRYVWSCEPIGKSVEKYYKHAFGVNMNNVDSVVKKYIEGLVWVFNYYYNDNPSGPNVWFYKYNNAPLLTQIYLYMNKIKDDHYLDQVQKGLSKYNVSVNDFFREEEHLIYVSPISLYPDIVPEKYVNVSKKIRYINVEKIVDDVMNENVSNEINCEGVTFLNKCHIGQLSVGDDPLVDWAKDKEFIKLLRG